MIVDQQILHASYFNKKATILETFETLRAQFRRIPLVLPLIIGMAFALARTTLRVLHLRLVAVFSPPEALLKLVRR